MYLLISSADNYTPLNLFNNHVGMPYKLYNINGASIKNWRLYHVIMKIIHYGRENKNKYFLIHDSYYILLIYFNKADYQT